MTFAAEASSRARQLALRATGGEAFPEALLIALASENVKRGWLRATGVLEDVELRRVVDPDSAPSRMVAGPIYLLSLECPIAAGAASAPALVFRGVVAFEGDGGYETMAAEVVRARVRTMDVLVTALDDLVAPRTWNAAIEATARTEDSAARPPAAAPKPAGSASPSTPSAMPQRPLRPVVDLDGLVPEVGDTVEHFAFGRGDVVKSDGDRLHIRAHKDGRIREIALQMLRVSLLDEPADSAGHRHFKLERRL